MKIEVDPEALRPVVVAVVAEALAQLGTVTGSDRLAYPEAEAASLLGLKSHQLRDARLRGEIQAVRLAGRIGYTREELAGYLARQRI